MIVLTLLAGAWLALAGPAETSSAAPISVFPQMRDYPADALAGRIEGDVSVTLHIGADGSLRCAVVTGDAPVVLKRPSCSLVAGRWPFAPKVEHGAAQASDLALLIRWRIADTAKSLPEDYGGATPVGTIQWVLPSEFPLDAVRENKGGIVGIAFDVTPGGTVTNCVVETPAKTAAFNAIVCPAVRRRALFLPAIDASGQAIVARAHVSVRFNQPQP